MLALIAGEGQSQDRGSELNLDLSLNLFAMIESPKVHFLSYLALGVGILSLGFSAIFVRWANAPGTVTSFYRMAIAVILLTWPFYRRVKTEGGLP